LAQITYREALQHALRDSMKADDSVIVIGEEVGAYGGAYGVTKGLMEEFGIERVIDTPISEAAIVGAAIGSAMTGLRPVAELMYVDFFGLTMDQIANQAAKTRYMFGGQIGVPMVLRTQGGTGRSAGAQHSQSLEAWIMHTPGLRLAMPATAADAYHLLRHSLTLPDPVVFIEHKALYARKEEADLSAPHAPWGNAVVRQSGQHLTLVTYSRMVHVALDAAKKLTAEGVNVEVIDLRTLNPLDIETVVASVNRTGRAVALSEGCLTGGVAAELAARITEECFAALEGPVIRIAAEDIPIPVSPGLESASIPTAEVVVNVIKRMVH
jgi:acetoin:2,6-dichlorophenolindophenol oxidoreductase subunit beta